MIGVDKIGEMRRAYFEQERPIKEIVRTLSVSRATARKVIRGGQTEFKYAREVQPTPKLGVWVEVPVEILEAESKLAGRDRRSTQRLFEEQRGRASRVNLPPNMRRARFARAGARNQRLDPHDPHQSTHPLPIDLAAFLVQLERHPPRAMERQLEVEFVEPAHQGLRPSRRQKGDSLPSVSVCPHAASRAESVYRRRCCARCAASG
jgi:hypothetical protein